MLLPPPPLPQPVTLYVAPPASGGSDANPGTAERPLATLKAAREALRAARDGPRTVWIAGGRYRETLVLEKQDSGTNDAPTVLQARPGEAVFLTGSLSVPWDALTPVTDAATLARVISEPARPHLRRVDLKALGLVTLDPVLPRGFSQPIRPAPPELFVNSVPMTLARWPNDGFTKTGALFGPGNEPTDKAPAGSTPCFAFADDRPALWKAAEDLWLMGYWKFDWAEESIHVTSIDLAQKRLTLASPHLFGVDAGKPYYAENLLEEIDQPGEYCLDRTRGLLYLYPPDAAGPDSLIQLSLETAPLVTLADASWITLRGLTLEASRGEGVLVRGGSGVRVEACTLRDLGNRAVSVEGGTRHTVEACDVHDTGEGGLAFTGGDRATLTPSGHLAQGNDIHRFNRRGQTYRPGISMYGVGLTARQNEIHDAPHSAIIFGGNDILLELNDIHDVLRLTGDGGAVYTGRDWTFRGNVIRHNFLHDLRGVGQWENAVYIDDQASGMTIAGNIFHNCHWGMLIGGGRDNLIQDNILSSCTLALQLDARGLGWGKDQLGPTLRTNLAAMPFTKEPWSTRYPSLAIIESDDPMTPKHNTIRRNLLLKSGQLTDRVEPEAAKHATIVENVETQDDPGFTNAAKGDFSLRPDERLTTLIPGFTPIPVDQIGPRRTPGAPPGAPKTK